MIPCARMTVAMWSDGRARPLVWLFLCLALLSLTGCGGGGGGAGATGGSFTVHLAPAKITQEGGATLDAIYGFVTGPDITGGWLEDQNGTRLPSSDLLYETESGGYEVILARSEGGFSAAPYQLVYLQGGETKTHRVQLLQWTTLNPFPSAPTLTEPDPIARMLIVRFQQVPGSALRYRLRLYNADTGTLRRLTYETDGVEIQEYLSATGNFLVVLEGNRYEGTALSGKVMHYFNDRTF